ncbi:starch-binding protein [Cytophagales bacterium WSM2-2]|nr:starch-binding protein [Cytophagales bacterium WSM2-2]
MKTNYLKYLLVLVACGITFSCKDYLNVNPVSSFGPDYVFNSVDNATKALIGAYSPLGGDNGYGIRVTMYYPYDNDEMMGQGGTPYPDTERRDIAHYNVTPGNTQLAAPFNQMYTGIERANICIYYIPKMSLYSGGTGEEQAALKRLHGEALTLRAQYYYELIRNWGDVPAQFLPSSYEKDLFKSREDRDVIYDQLLTDLELAATLVPWRSQVPVDERITQGAVRALRARIALAKGGYSLRSDNTMKRPSNYKDYYQIAMNECLAVMQSGDHHLNSSYQSVFKDAIAAHTLEPNGEILWEVAMTGGSSATGDSKFAYYNGPRVAGNGNGALTILPTYFYSFDVNDTRRDVTCAPYDVNLDGTIAARTAATIVDGKFRRDWITNPTPSPTSTQQYFGLNWPMIRFSDVLLMYAEADNEINGAPSGAAIIAFEQVRKRAFGNASIGTTPADYNGFFNAIVNERSWELGGEGIRKYDLIRWNMLGQKIADTKAKLTLMYQSLPPYNNYPTTMYYKTNSASLIWLNPLNQPTPAVQPAGSTSVSWIGASINTTILQFYAVAFTPGKNELLPIATSVLNSNPNLTQNNF